MFVEGRVGRRERKERGTLLMHTLALSARILFFPSPRGMSAGLVNLSRTWRQPIDTKTDTAITHTESAWWRHFMLWRGGNKKWCHYALLHAQIKHTILATYRNVFGGFSVGSCINVISVTDLSSENINLQRFRLNAPVVIRMAVESISVYTASLSPWWRLEHSVETSASYFPSSSW